jgi:hypothetical protein
VKYYRHREGAIFDHSISHKSIKPMPSPEQI